MGRCCAQSCWGSLCARRWISFQGFLQLLEARPMLREHAVASPGSDLWHSLPRRLRLCESCNVSGFLEDRDPRDV